MSERVLSTSVARQSIQKMTAIVNGPLSEQIEALMREGQTLSDPRVWNGRLAMKFRDQWAERHNLLRQIIVELEQLRVVIQRINEDIMTAGGG